MAHAPIRTHLCLFTTGSSISTMFLSNLPSDSLRARAIAWKSFGGVVNFSAGLHLIDQLGKGSEECSVCKPFAYSRLLRLFPWLTLYADNANLLITIMLSILLLLTSKFFKSFLIVLICIFKDFVVSYSNKIRYTYACTLIIYILFQPVIFEIHMVYKSY